MAREEVKPIDAISLTDYPNKPMVCFYINSKMVNTKFGEQMLHNFEKEDGTKISVWGFASLNRLLEYTPRGIEVEVTYTGKADVANKYGNHSHTCTVFFDTDKKLEGFKEVEPGVEDVSDLPF